MAASIASDSVGVSPEWLSWMQDFRAAADRVLLGAPTEVPAIDAELISAMYALFARLITFLATAIILAEHDKLLDLRIYGRLIIECAQHLDAAKNLSRYLEMIRADDQASRRSRARAFAKRNPRLDVASRKALDRLIARDGGKAKRLEPIDLSSGKFNRLAHVYREISADASHVTFTSLSRHSFEGADGRTMMVTDPELKKDELDETLSVIALSALISTFIILGIIGETSNDNIEALMPLATRYKELYRLRVALPAETQLSSVGQHPSNSQTLPDLGI